MLWFINLHCQYLPYSIHFSEFMAIFFSRENGQSTNNIRSLPFLYDMKMSAEGY